MDEKYKDFKNQILEFQKIRKKNKIAIVLLLILFGFLIFFNEKIDKNPVYQENVQTLISENNQIEADINQQILIQKAQQIGIKPIHSQNPDIKDYLNLYLQKSTTIWDAELNTAITYNGRDTVVKAVKLINGNTVFTLNNKNYYLKEE